MDPHEAFGGDDIFGHIFGGGGGGMASPFGGLGGFLGGFGGGGRRRGPTRGEDTVHRLKVSLEELYVGKVSKLQLSKNTICTDCGGVGGHGTINTCGECRGRGITVTVNQIGPGMVQQMQSKCRSCDGEGELMAESDRCKTCSGRKVVPNTKLLEVTVEPGMRDEQKIVFRGEGDQVPGVEPGNVLIVLQEKPHATFNLFCAPTDCVRGISGEGMPVYQQPTEKGDLYIQFTVDFPQNYFAEGDKLKELESLLGGRGPALPIPTEHEDVDLSEFEQRSRSSHEDDDDIHGHGMHGPQVQCAHQ
ncbi:Heat shock protein DnaJ cysteine-rich domain [Trinorchestia longiramus]|nr:Heat shock protein DnaJ cysteine-rich domain [Trinorchestia longiramus]